MTDIQTPKIRIKVLPQKEAQPKYNRHVSHHHGDKENPYAHTPPNEINGIKKITDCNDCFLLQSKTTEKTAALRKENHTKNAADKGENHHATAEDKITSPDPIAPRAKTKRRTKNKVTPAKERKASHIRPIINASKQPTIIMPKAHVSDTKPVRASSTAGKIKSQTSAKKGEYSQRKKAKESHKNHKKRDTLPSRQKRPNDRYLHKFSIKFPLLRCFLTKRRICNALKRTSHLTCFLINSI